MKLPFMPERANPELEHARQEMNYGREQNDLSRADSIKDEIMLQYQQEREDLIRWQQDLDDEAIQLIHDLKNEILVGDQWQPYGEPLMNEAGIRKIISDIRPFLSRNMINCNYSEERVLDMLKRSSTVLSRDLHANYDKYDLDFKNIRLILRWVKNVKMSAPHRAMNGWNKELDSRINKRVETFSTGLGSEQQKKRLFGIF